jgi:hypothetical protein
MLFIWWYWASEDPVKFPPWNIYIGCMFIPLLSGAAPVSDIPPNAPPPELIPIPIMPDIGIFIPYIFIY